MSIALLATGDEIISGDTLNTNTYQLANLLFSEGFPVGLQLACGDSEDEIIRCLKFLTQNHQTILITGGLGPTSDDKTRFALAKYTKQTLIEHDEAMGHMIKILNRANLSMNEGNRQQALFPSHAALMPNPYGTAMGGYFSHAHKRYFLLPGPPRECLPMFEQHVLPALVKEIKSDLIQLKWRLFGVAEGEISAKLDDALKGQPCETGYRLEVPYVEFKVRCQGSQTQIIQNIIDPMVSAYIISPADKRASQVLKEKISHLDMKVEILDEATGGLLQRSIQSKENHNFLSFVEIKKAKIHFRITGLQEYWRGEQASVTQLNLAYRCNDKTGGETYNIPFRSPLVLDYAAEWLSFRLLHFIDEFHQ